MASVRYLVGRGYQIWLLSRVHVFHPSGITELAYLVFPFFTANLYGYVPGMASVVPRAPSVWLGMWRSRR
ncbi:conserved hypothetical protein [Mesorhizobium delmotii]|uniref:Uncharacterized protein n=1 Tax=Mesorhizobium delmotii TaxID=1631247 RepID=A0A2P9ARF2_9HYPH|nr:conserved hypothetical protein [Mesorhizobium delmotii]